jgi:sortase A
LPSKPPAERTVLESVTAVNFGDWSPKRIDEYKASLAEHFDEPLAVLKMNKIHLEVPIFEGTSDLVLNRGVGRIEGTARVGEAGNVGLAGHRDGFFRGLKDVKLGDTMELETVAGKQTYIIDSIKLVERTDVSVLKNESLPELTLVTCYPFYFVGSAPRRYIVHASLDGEMKTLNASAKASSQATDSSTKENTQ